jgi:phosphatidylinositol-3-phosphatase
VQKSCPTWAHLASVSIFILSILALAAYEDACGGSLAMKPPGTPSPAFSHVFLVVEENHSYSDVIGNSSMPYFNSLASQYGLASQYFADAHPSLPDYLMFTTGQMETMDNNFNGVISDDNSIRELVKAGKTWKAYLESIPSQGYLGGDAPPYLRRHNPFSYLSDCQNDPSQAANIVPYSQLQTDLANGTLPQYSFIAPNVNNDAHNGTLPEADAWLQNNIAPLLASAAFKSSGLLIIIFDESEVSDTEHGGGHVPAVIVSSKSKMNYQSQTFYQHESVLRLILDSSGVTVFPGMSSSAPDMTEFFASL